MLAGEWKNGILKRKTVSRTMLILLSISMLTLAFSIQAVESSGTIYIRADGSVDPPTAPIQRDGDIYTFTGNIYETVEVQKDNLIVDGNGFTLQGGTDYGFFLPERNNVTIKNTRIVGFSTGILLYSSSGNTVSNNTIISNQWFGISIQGASIIQVSSNNVITNNTVTDTVCGMQFHGGGEFHNTIVGNNISANVMGIQLSESARYNAFSCNTISNNDYGFIIMDKPEDEENSDNRIFHNNFIDNTYQAVDNGTNNVWDDDYPSGGNYWSDYGGIDFYSGPYQNETTSDGIGDTPYFIDEDNQDKYPLMEPWSLKPLGPLEALEELIQTVESWNLDKGIETSLTSKLQAAYLAHRIEKNQNAAIGQLTAFINEVEALRDKKLTIEQTDQLTSEAQRIIDLIKGETT